MSRILIAEDDKEICQILTDFLESYNYKTVCCFSGMDVLSVFNQESFDLVILDLMLPYVSGEEILCKIRKFSDIPIIIVSAKDLVLTKVELLRLGADDYVTKPFNLEELLARIERCLIRNQKTLPEMQIVSGDLVLDTQSKSVSIHDTILSLTAKEYQILELLMKYPNKVFSKQNLYEAVWNEAFARDNDVMNTHISNLRKKLGDEGWRIETIWGLGYRFIKN